VLPFSDLISKQKEYVASGETRSISFRLAQLATLRQIIQDNEAMIFDALKKDLGKSSFESYATEVGFILDSIQYFRKNLRKWSKDTHFKTPFHQPLSKSFTRYEPYGTTLIIGPFNYPFQLLIEPLLGALAAGNTAIVKPSELAPHTEQAIQHLLTKTFPEEYLAVVTGGAETNQKLLEQELDYVFFTGSVRVGRIIMEACAKKLIPLTLELGGKSPAIIHESAKMDVTTDRIAWGKFLNAGQTCIAPDFVYLHESRVFDFRELMERTLREFYGADPSTSEDYGRIISDYHFDRLIKLMEPEEVWIGGNYNRTTRYIAPCVLGNISWDAPIMQEEIFGPLLPVIIYKDEKKMIQTLQQQPKPLALYVFAEERRFQESILSQLSFGGGCINDTISHIVTPRMPFGGVGTSGMGRYHGKYSFETFSHQKAILKKPTWFNVKLAFPPYSEGKLKWIRRLIG
jgi:aldehyde dehydrogenase (NAD+)